MGVLGISGLVVMFAPTLSRGRAWSMSSWRVVLEILAAGGPSSRSPWTVCVAARVASMIEPSLLRCDSNVGMVRSVILDSIDSMSH